MGSCPLCNHDRKQPLTKGLCTNHYWQGIRMKSVEKMQEREVSDDEGLATLVADLDVVFSQYIRIKDADKDGNVACFCCGSIGRWQDMDCAHFVPRANMYTRFSENNCKPNCQTCNRREDGNLAAYAQHLEADNVGSVESLLEQGRLVYKYTIDELKSLLLDYTLKLKLLKQ
jgi:NinG protein